MQPPPATHRSEYLRIIGRHVDRQRLQRITVLQLPDGYLLRTTPHAKRSPLLIEFPLSALPELYDEARQARGKRQQSQHASSPLAPTGYEDLLRAIGNYCDDHEITSIVVAEGATAIFVTGLQQRQHDQAGATPCELLLTRDQIAQLLDYSFRRRQ